MSSGSMFAKLGDLTPAGDPTYLAGLEASLDGPRMAGLSEQ
jgi:hypothetical protein